METKKEEENIDGPMDQMTDTLVSSETIFQTDTELDTSEVPVEIDMKEISNKV